MSEISPLNYLKGALKLLGVSESFYNILFFFLHLFLPSFVLFSPLGGIFDFEGLEEGKRKKGRRKGRKEKEKEEKRKVLVLLRASWFIVHGFGTIVLFPLVLFLL